MLDIFSQVKQAGKYVNHLIKLPVRCWIFLFGILFYYQPRLVKVIDIKSWFPSSIYNVISFVLKLIFNNFLEIIIILVILEGLFLLLNKLPEEIKERMFSKSKLIDGENTKVYSPICASIVVYNIFIEMVTTLWSFYFLFLTLFDRDFLFILLHADNNFILQLFFWGICFTINILFLLFEISKSLFIISIPRLDNYIDRDEWNLYTKIAYFEYGGYPENYFVKEKIKILFLKAKNKRSNMYYIVELQLTNHYLKEKYNTIKIPNGKQKYKIINSSENFEEIKFHYESIKLEKIKECNRII
jgi:hypothetical protein